jgi:hypothetical protein
MYFNQWVIKQISDLKISRRELCSTTGICYSTISTSKKFNPRLDNLVLVCEVLNEKRGGDKASFDALIIEAIKSSIKDYSYAVERIQKGGE